MTKQIILEFIGEVDNNNIKALENTILSKKEDIQLQKNKMVLVSLKNVLYKDNFNNLKLMFHKIDEFAKSLDISVAFMDYSTELYTVLKVISKNTKIKLFKTEKIAKIFLEPESFKENTTVLVFDEDESNSKQLYFVLSKNNYNIERAKTIEEFLEAIKTEKYDVIVTKSLLNEVHKEEQAVKAKLSLSKKLIMNLPTFMNKAAETLCSFTGLEAKKVSHSIKSFDTSLQTNTISAVMPFKGDLEGYFTLVFPSDIAITALEALLGETVKENDTATLKDGVGEFCNIITGAAKTEFDTKGIKAVFELPKTYTSLVDTQKHIGKNTGVWMDMQLSGKPFYMFITK
jgi:CheY-specific phosphatase CheX